MAAAVAVDQREAALRLGRQRRAHDRHHRRDPGTGGNRQIFTLPFSLRLITEMPLRHHHLQFHTLLDIVLGVAREAPAVDGFDRDANFAWRAAATNGVTAAQFFAAQTGF